MTPQEIKANAPFDATHYHLYETPVFPNSIEYAKFINGVRYIYNSYFSEWMIDVVLEDKQSSGEFKLLYEVS